MLLSWKPSCLHPGKIIYLQLKAFIVCRPTCPPSGKILVYGFPQAFFVSKETPTAEWRYEKERHSAGLEVSKLHLVQGRIFPLPPSPPSTPATGKIREAGRVSALPPPPSTHALLKLNLCDFQRPRPKARMASTVFRGSKVLQLNSDSFCDCVRIWTEVIGHLWAELGFWFFPGKRWKYMRPQIFGQDANILARLPVQQPV